MNFAILKKIAVVFAAVLFVFVSSVPVIVKADDSSTTLTEDLPDYVGWLESQGYDLTGYDYYLLCEPEGYSQRFCISTQPIVVTFYNGNQPGFYFSGSFYEVKYSGSTFLFEFSGSDFIVYYAPGMSLGQLNVKYSNHDIYHGGTIFFTPTPYPGKMVVGGLTLPVVQDLMMAEVTGLLPLAVGLMILGTTLYKGLQFLLMRLKAA